MAVLYIYLYPLVLLIVEYSKINGCSKTTLKDHSIVVSIVLYDNWFCNSASGYLALEMLKPLCVCVEVVVSVIDDCGCGGFC